MQVPKLLQPFPIGELLTQSEAAIFGETEDIELLVGDELRHALFPKILIYVPQILGREPGADLAEVVAEVHVVGLHVLVSHPNSTGVYICQTAISQSVGLRQGD